MECQACDCKVNWKYVIVNFFQRMRVEEEQGKEDRYGEQYHYIPKSVLWNTWDVFMLYK